MITKIIILLALFAISNGSPIPGNKTEIIEGRIIGGVGTTVEQVPWIASLRTSGNFHFCGASIISESWVLSAAHCTINTTPARVFVWVGTSFLRSGGIRHSASRIVNHHSYNPQTFVNDISLVQTATTITMNSQHTSIIPLATSSTPGGVSALAAGWGQTAWGTPDQVQALNVQTITLSACQSIMGPSVVTATKLCTATQWGRGELADFYISTAKFYDYFSGICSGDSGGPLSQNRVLIGVASWTAGNCASGGPDGWDSVSAHRTWILSNSF